MSIENRYGYSYMQVIRKIEKIRRMHGSVHHSTHWIR